MCLNSKTLVDEFMDFDDYRNELKRSLAVTYSKLQEAVTNFNSKIAIEPINREALDSFPYMEWIVLNDKVEVRKRKKRFKDYLCFDTRMKRGGEFGEHFHADMIESTEVVSGEMVDTYDGKIYKEGDVAHYETGEKHTPIATQDTLLHVLFKPFN